MDVKRVVEAILFSSSKPVSLKKLSQAIKVPKGEIKRIIRELSKEYDENKNAWTLMEIAGGYCLWTRPEFYPYIKAFNPNKIQKLSKPALETLTIIAYKQPITKTEITNIRRVSVDWTVRILLERGLIKAVGRLDHPGRPYVYGTTRKFLETFGLKSLDDLPRLE